jgi:hypothetical protein
MVSNNVMVEGRKRGVAALGLLLVAGGAGDAAGQPSAPPAGAGSAQPSGVGAEKPEQPGKLEKKQEARNLFQKGTRLLEAGDPERALEFFLQSRRLFPSFSATANAAVSFEKLGRLDESLELYEQLLTEFSSSMTDDERRSVAATMSDLRRRVGGLDVAANVDGKLVVGGKLRGVLPLTSPVRLLPGRHRVRVIKEGYEPFDVEVTIAAGKIEVLDARLAPLTSVGRLSVSEAGGERGLEVLVDGAPMGVTPWEGSLSAGSHLVLLRGNTRGTSPAAVTVVVGQSIATSLRAVPLGPLVQIEPSPRSARITIDGVAVGAGPWEGRLAEGAHEIEADEDGYFAARRSLAQGAAGAISIALKVDEAHPRWPRPEKGHIIVSAFGGLGIGPTLGSDAERACPARCTSSGVPLAMLAGGRVGYEFLSGLRTELSLGYVRLGRSVRRELPSPVGGVDTLRVADTLRVQGAMLGVGLGYSLAVSAHTRLVARLTVAAAAASASDALDASYARGSDEAALTVDRGGASERGLLVMGQPEGGVEWSSGGFFVGAGFGTLLVLTQGPALPHGEAAVVPVPACPTGSQSVACAQGTPLLAGERAHRQTAFFSLLSGAGYRF